VELIAEMSSWTEAVALLTAKTVALDHATREGVLLMAHRTEAATKRTLATSSHGRRTPTPSNPGEPPSMISGNLMRSIAVQGPVGLAGAWEASVGPTAVYGRIQELGGRTGRGHRTTLPPRPYLEPSWESVRVELVAIMAGVWRRALEV